MNLIKSLLFFSTVLLLGACDSLTKDVDIDLPDYERQPVVECYLEPGKPFRLLLTQSYSFFDPFGLDSSFLQKTLLQGALVTISYDGKTDTLPNNISIEPSPIKIFNYTGANLVPATPGTVFTLNITLADGGSITGETTMLPYVPIDSIVVEFSETKDSLARALTYITDDLGTTNYYRRILNYSALDSFPEQDFLVNDDFSTTSLIAFGTGYELKEGDTIFNSIFHITKAHYDYLESVQLAIFGNLNPFATPSPIKSNVSGTARPLGVFAPLVYDRDTTIIRK